MTYHAQSTPTEFNSTFVDAMITTYTDSNGVTRHGIDSSDNNQLVLAGIGEDHGFQTGDEVVYTVSGGPVIGGLLNLGHYWVIRLDAQRIQLADSRCHAVGWAADNSCTTPNPDSSQPPLHIDRTPLPLAPDKSTTGTAAPTVAAGTWDRGSSMVPSCSSGGRSRCFRCPTAGCAGRI